MHRKLTFLVLLIALGMVLSACGGDDQPNATAIPTVTATPTEVSILASIPTWTPVPTSTPAPPRATIEVDYATSTNTHSSASTPTATQDSAGAPTSTQSAAAQPTAAAPTSAPPTVAVPTQAVQVGVLNPTLTISLDALTPAVANALASAPIASLAGQPTLQIKNGQLVIEGPVTVTTADGNTRAPVTVRANILQVQGQPALSVEEAFFTADGSLYQGDLTGAYLDLVEDVLVTLVEEQYFTVRPDDQGYFVALITIENPTIQLQTVSIPE